MLVLERKVSEGVWIGDAFIKILPGTSKGRIRLGIDAPREILVLRDELADKNENRPRLRAA